MFETEGIQGRERNLCKEHFDISAGVPCGSLVLFGSPCGNR